MRHIRIVAFVALICATTLTAARAQQPAATSGPPSLAGKVAVIDTSAFADEQNGIRRVIEVLRRIDAEFKPRSDELQQMRARYDGLVKQINAGTGDAAALRRAADDADQLKRDIDRRSEDAKTAYQKRVSEQVGPVQDDVFKALDAYAKENGIAIIIDASQVPIIFADGPKVDITQNFINIYNQRNPAVAGAPSTTGSPAAQRPIVTTPTTRPTATPAPRRP
jgi:Skp family chaperone for outer membrane proteins